MSEAVKAVTFLNIVFILLLAISGTLGGILGECLYYLAFFVPIAIGFYYSKGLKYKREEVKGVAEPHEGLLSIGRTALIKLLPLVFPVVVLVMMTSAVTSLLMSIVGISSAPVEQTDIFTMLVVDALVPAVLEELLFRYVPMKLLLPYSARMCVIYSAVCFALIHCSFVQMPYALVAGAVFMVVDIALGSVWPSVILHLVNNSTSVILMKYCSEATAALAFVAVLLLIALISLIFIIRRRDEYARDLRCALARGESFKLGYAPVMLTLICCYLAWSSI